jgi:hypothetical protein
VASAPRRNVRKIKRLGESEGPMSGRYSAEFAPPSKRYIVFQVLPHTLGLGLEVWRVLSKCHDIRNMGEYEGDLGIDERIVVRIVVDLIAACNAVAAKRRPCLFGDCGNTVTENLRDFCGTQCWFVVLSGANCNGRPLASG